MTKSPTYLCSAKFVEENRVTDCGLKPHVPDKQSFYDRDKEIEELKAEILRLNGLIASLEESAAMACENPCGDCAGCNYAKELLGDKHG